MIIGMTNKISLKILIGVMSTMESKASLLAENNVDISTFNFLDFQQLFATPCALLTSFECSTISCHEYCVEHQKFVRVNL